MRRSITTGAIVVSLSLVLVGCGGSSSPTTKKTSTEIGGGSSGLSANAQAVA